MGGGEKDPIRKALYHWEAMEWNNILDALQKRRDHEQSPRQRSPSPRQRADVISLSSQLTESLHETPMSACRHAHPDFSQISRGCRQSRSRNDVTSQRRPQQIQQSAVDEPAQEPQAPALVQTRRDLLRQSDLDQRRQRDLGQQRWDSESPMKGNVFKDAEMLEEWSSPRSPHSQPLG